MDRGQKDSNEEGAAGNPGKNFRVAIRLCPQRHWDPQTDEARCSIKVVEPNRIVVDTGRGHQPHSLLFDAVWNESANQKDIYESTARPLVGSLVQGYNGCVIAYGSPCSGKTYTMLGGSLTGKQRGILSRVAEDIFNSPDASTCSVRVSFYHISNEKIYDLLDSQPSEVSRIHEGEDAVVLEGLKEVEVGSPQALLQVYRCGATKRQAGTSKGDFASRSHAIFNITVINTKASLALGGGLTASKLTLVDLASSGKARSRSNAALEVKRCFQTVPENPQEAKTLKRSLTIFGNVIFALSMAGCHHVPYRESKLTRVLRDCLGGNCRMSLIVTVSPHLSSVTETLSSLQFASRAMAIPGRPVQRSQLQCALVQGQSAVTERSVPAANRQHTHTPFSGDKRPTAQTCLPPIPSGPSSPPFRPGHRQPDDPEQKAFLPHLEKQSQYEGSCGGSHFGFPAGRGGHCPPEERAAVGGRTTESRASRVLSSRPRSYSSSLSGPLPLPQDGGGGGGGGGAGREKVVYPSPRRSVERLSASSSASAMGPCAPASLSSAPAECPNCKRERKIREEYDKFIVQARRDRDSLNQRVAELEARLLTRGAEREEEEQEEEEQEREKEEHEQREEEEEEEEEAMEISRCNTAEIPVNAEEQTPGSAESPQDMESLREDVESLRDDPREETRGEAVSSTLNGKQKQQLEKESNQLKGQILALQRELEVSREQLDQSAAREKLRSERRHGEQAKAAQDTQGLQTQLNQARQQTESLLSELRSSKAEHERFKENVALTVAQLQKDKDDLMSNLDEVRECYEKVKSENAVLSERVETLKREANHGLHGNSGPSHVHTVTTNTEMLVVSHHVSQQCSGGMNTDSKCCYTSCSGFQERPVPPSPEKPPEDPEDRTEQEPSPLRTEPPEDPENGTEQEPSLLKTKHAFKQLRREHSLLLDVMLVLYKREWFAQEAVPYVRRTLSKCGMKVDEMN